MNRTYSESETAKVAKEILSIIRPSKDRATVLGLTGELGAGKTTLVQALAKELSVAETVVSPTFVIAKWYETVHKDFSSLVHIDAYRIESEDELVPLGFNQLLAEPGRLVIIEWPEKIETTLSFVPLTLFAVEHDGESRIITGPHTYEENR